MAPSRTVRLQQGLTLVELAITLVIISLVLGTALPSLAAMKAKRQLEGAAAQLETELQYARFSAVSLNRTVRVAFYEGTGGTCYVIHTGSPGDCTCNAAGTTHCEDGALALRTAVFGTTSPIQVTSNSRSIGFDATNGSVTPTGTIEVRNGRDEAIRLVVNIMGRVRSCSAAAGVPGLPRC